jgi:beta-lactamase superfamily II metal-dependent hydrolase
VNDSGLTLFVKGANGNAMLPGDCKYTIAEGETNEAIEKMGAKNRDLCLVIPHHGGKAGKCVTYNVPEAKAIEGIVSVGENNGYGHPNDEVMKQIKTSVPKVRMIEMVVATTDMRNCLRLASPLPVFRLLGVCNLIFI